MVEMGVYGEVFGGGGVWGHWRFASEALDLKVLIDELPNICVNSILRLGETEASYTLTTKTIKVGVIDEPWAEMGSAGSGSEGKC